jgi:hypothetical protein
MRPRLGVTQHRALWSPDFPRPVQAYRRTGRDRLADLGINSMIAHDWGLSSKRKEANSQNRLFCGKVWAAKLVLAGAIPNQVCHRIEGAICQSPVL